MPKIDKIYEMAKDNDNFRKVVVTGPHVQVVIMSIPPGGDIGEEVHKDNDQLLFLVEGHGMATLDAKDFIFKIGDTVLVPAGTKHNFTNISKIPMKIITSYSPPHHPDGTVHKTKADADKANKKKVAATTAATFQAL